MFFRATLGVFLPFLEHASRNCQILRCTPSQQSLLWCCYQTASGVLCCVFWRLGYLKLLGCYHIVWATLFYWAYKHLVAPPLSCLSFFHISVKIASAVASLVLLLPPPPPPSGCRLPTFRLAFFSAVPRRQYCAQFAKFLGLRPSLVCTVRPSNQKCTRYQELGSKCLCMCVLAAPGPCPFECCLLTPVGAIHAL